MNASLQCLSHTPLLTRYFSRAHQVRACASAHYYYY